jgi:hypothetical protein
MLKIESSICQILKPAGRITSRLNQEERISEVPDKIKEI